jgi:hypothetical protein
VGAQTGVGRTGRACGWQGLIPHPPHQPTFFFVETARKPVGGAAAEEGRDVWSALGSDEAGDGGMDKATHVAIARACDVDRVGGGGESGAREGGKDDGGGGGGWLSGLSAAAAEVPLNVEPGIADRGS